MVPECSGLRPAGARCHTPDGGTVQHSVGFRGSGFPAALCCSLYQQGHMPYLCLHGALEIWWGCAARAVKLQQTPTGLSASPFVVGRKNALIQEEAQLRRHWGGEAPACSSSSYKEP